MNNNNTNNTNKELNKSITFVTDLYIKNRDKFNQNISIAQKDVIVDLIHKFIKNKNLLVYGGQALNAILPKKEKIYKEGEFKDYDILSPNAEIDARELADELYSNNFVYTQIKPAIHEGTYKLSVNFVDIVDFTQVSDKLFYEMLKMSNKEKNSFGHKLEILVAPLNLLKLNLIQEMSIPISSLWRWAKVYNRLFIFSRNFKTMKVKSPRPLPTIEPPRLKNYVNVYKTSLEFIKIYKLPLIGNLAINVHLKQTHDIMQCCRLDEFFSIFEILSTNPYDTFKSLDKHMELILKELNLKLHSEERYYYGEIIPKRLRVYLLSKDSKLVNEKISLLTIVEARNHCYSITEIGGFVVGSPYTILYFLYAYWLVYSVYESKKIVKMIEIYITLLEEHVSKISDEEKFILQCYGNEKQFIDLLKEQFHDKTKTYLYRPLYKSTIKPV